jgi:hypothetical protein
MKIVNPYAIRDFLSGLAGMGDDDEYIIQYRQFDSNDSEKSKEVIQRELVPEFNRLPIKTQEFAKLSLRYYLTTDRVRWGRVYDGCLFPFDHPKNPRDFFVWIWEVMYPGESCLLEKTDDYTEDFDIEGPLKHV